MRSDHVRGFGGGLSHGTVHLGGTDELGLIGELAYPGNLSRLNYACPFKLICGCVARW